MASVSLNFQGQFRDSICLCSSCILLPVPIHHNHHKPRLLLVLKRNTRCSWSLRVIEARDQFPPWMFEHSCIECPHHHFHLLSCLFFHLTPPIYHFLSSVTTTPFSTSLNQHPLSCFERFIASFALVDSSSSIGRWWQRWWRETRGGLQSWTCASQQKETCKFDLISSVSMFSSFFWFYSGLIIFII